MKKKIKSHLVFAITSNRWRFIFSELLSCEIHLKITHSVVFFKKNPLLLSAWFRLNNRKIWSDCNETWVKIIISSDSQKKAIVWCIQSYLLLYLEISHGSVSWQKCIGAICCHTTCITFYSSLILSFFEITITLLYLEEKVTLSKM